MYTEQDITNLVARVQQLEQQAAMPKQVLLPDYGILSHNFLTRAFSVWGLYFVASLIIGIAIAYITTVLGLIFGASAIDWINQLLGNLPV
jgi:flagellar biosynthesis protein FliP